jgi:hypothetical protein
MAEGGVMSCRPFNPNGPLPKLNEAKHLANSDLTPVRSPRIGRCRGHRALPKRSKAPS